MYWRAAAVVLAAALMAGCYASVYPYPYRSHTNPPGQNPAGTPADRTGGARNVPDDAGGGPKTNTWPADS